MSNAESWGLQQGRVSSTCIYDFRRDFVRGKLSSVPVFLNKYFHPYLSSLTLFTVSPFKLFNVYNVSTFSMCLHVRYHKCRYAMQQFPAEWEKKDCESCSSARSLCKAASFWFLFCLCQEQEGYLRSKIALSFHFSKSYTKGSGAALWGKTQSCE